MSDKKLYFIAIVPPEPVYSEAEDWKHHLAEKYQSKAALRSPPHVTLHMPFKWREDKEGLIFEMLENLVANQNPFEVSLNGFGAFDPRVIYIHVEENEPLTNLHNDLKKAMKMSLNVFNADFKQRGFAPHLTIAFRDLKKAAFKKAWSEFEEKEYKRLFTATSVILLKHNGKQWDIFRSFGFNG